MIIKFTALYSKAKTQNEIFEAINSNDDRTLITHWSLSKGLNIEEVIKKIAEFFFIDRVNVLLCDDGHILPCIDDQCIIAYEKEFANK